MTLEAVLLLVSFGYALLVSFLAYRESGETWMLFFPTWIDTRSGVSRRTRAHGGIAFALLLVALVVFAI